VEKAEQPVFPSKEKSAFFEQTALFAEVAKVAQVVKGEVRPSFGIALP